MTTHLQKQAASRLHKLASAAKCIRRQRVLNKYAQQPKPSSQYFIRKTVDPAFESVDGKYSIEFGERNGGSVRRRHFANGLPYMSIDSKVWDAMEQNPQGSPIGYWYPVSPDILQNPSIQGLNLKSNKEKSDRLNPGIFGVKTSYPENRAGNRDYFK